MKLTLLTLACSIALFCGCATTPSTVGLRVGMTEAQVEEYFGGEPQHTRASVGIVEKSWGDDFNGWVVVTFNFRPDYPYFEQVTGWETIPGGF